MFKDFIVHKIYDLKAMLLPTISELACGYINLSIHITSAALSVCFLAPDGHVGWAVFSQSQNNPWMDFFFPWTKMTAYI